MNRYTVSFQVQNLDTGAARSVSFHAFAESEADPEIQNEIADRIPPGHRLLPVETRIALSPEPAEP